MSETPDYANLVKAVNQLRGLVCGLGLMLFLVSVSLSGFLLKQSHVVSSRTNANKEQMNLIKANEEKMRAVINDLAAYSGNRPDLLAIFHNHGVDVKQSPAVPTVTH